MAGDRNQGQHWRPGEHPAPVERRDWRRKHPSSAGRASGETHRGLRDGSLSSPWYGRYRYLVRMLGMTAVLAVLLGAWFAYLRQTHIQVPLFAIVVTDYPSAGRDLILPPNTLAYEDLRLFERLFGGDGQRGVTRNVGLVKLIEGACSGAWLRDRLPELLSSAGGSAARPPGGPDQDVVMFYISAHGAVSAQGEACLLMSDSDPLDCTTWVPVADVLTSLKKSERYGSCKKVVFLDASRMRENWQMGIMCNTFPHRLEQAVANADDPNLVVFNSAATGDTAWSEPERGGTMFGRAVAGGLAGEADTSSWVSRLVWLNKIRLSDLRDHVTGVVQATSLRQRGAGQTPQVHHLSGSTLPDWRLVHSAGKSLLDVERAEDVDAWKSRIVQRADEVGSLWDRIDALAPRDPYETQPQAWAWLQAALVRLESLMIAGAAYDGQYTGLRGEVDRQLSRLESEPEANLASVLRVAGGRDAWQAAADQYVASLPLTRQLVPRSEAEFEQHRAQWLADPRPLHEAFARLGYVDAVEIGIRWLDQMPSPVRAQLQQVVELADRCRGNRGGDLVELQFLKLVTRDVEDTPALRERLVEAARCRFVAERAAAARDPRVLPWIEPSVRALDDRRRQGEDRLLLGQTDGLSVDDWRALRADYEEAEKAGNRVADVLGVKDRAWAELAGLAQWKMRELQRQSGGQLSSQWQTLLELIRDVHQLNASLAQAEPVPITVLEERAGHVRRAIDRLWEERNRLAADLIHSTTADADSLHRALTILDAPLRCGARVTDASESRGAIVRRFAAQLFGSQAVSRASLPDRVVEQGANNAFLQEACHWEHHPLAALVLEAATGPAPLRSDRPLATVPNCPLHWESQETAIRAYMRSGLSGRLDAAADRTAELLRVAGEDPTREAGSSLQEAEHLFRAAVPVAPSVLSPLPDPARLLRQTAQLRQFLWQYQRTLDDSYLASSGGAPASGTFVHVAGEQYAAACRKVEEILADTLRREFRSPNREHRIAGANLTQLAAARAGARLGPLQVAEIRLPEPDGDVEVSVARMITHELSIAGPRGLPADGLGFLELSRDGQPLAVQDPRAAESVPRTRHPLPVRPETDPWTFPFQLRQDELFNVRTLSARAYFRGGWYDQPIPVQPLGKGIEIVYPKPVYDPPRVTVAGDSTRPAVIVFVLDCSSSMSESISMEGRQERKMDQAQRALRSIIEDIWRYQQQLRGTYRVDVVLFGHRSNWPRDLTTTPDDPKFFRNPQGAPIDVHPSDDAEAVFGKVVELTEENKNRLLERIDGVRPWGVTPLYQSIMTALEVIRNSNVPASSSQRVVVVTDGVNYAPRGDKARQRREETPHRVRDAQPQHPDVRIDVVFFDRKGMEKEYQGDRRAVDAGLQALKSIVEAYNGQDDLYYANEPFELVDRLRRMIKPAEVQLRRAAGDAPASVVELGRTWSHPSWRGQLEEWQLAVADPRSGAEATANVRLEGGEHLELIYDGSTLRHKPDGLKVESPRRDPQGQFFVAALAPTWLQGELTFRVMVRNADPRQFSPRPQQVWAEITPVGNRDPQPFVFYDLEFENEMPVPVLRFRTRDWPLDTTRAQIRLWFQMEPLTAWEYERPIESLPADTWFPLGDAEFRVESQPPSAGRRIFVVRERYAQSPETHFAGRRVQLVPPPDATTHKYWRAEREIRHVFRYDAGTGLVSPHLRVARKETSTAGPLTIAITEDPIEVGVPTSSR